VKGVSSWKK